ncbi:MAG: cob(I)yrinic acid a,c-diamide adenosyltransferase [Kiritimatiellae bacterium]|nr:cob(I)yrinic acid a,c-diamide adenosyltransferase [Kiritimatiellia bacterium]
MNGYVHIYTGDGKGKTTAALGLIVRATGAGLRVYMGQFLKRADTCESRTLRARFPDVTVERYGRGGFVRGKPSTADTAAARRGLTRLRRAVQSGQYDVVIADEANVAVALGLLPAEAFLRLIDDKPAPVELVLTGRGADRRLLAKADLVTEMTCRKHYYAAGVRARRGIER